ncbi:hypothetical protein [Mucilaginibacter auburnensis]|uniref:Uncharacterized protein n=1 Tax=Mucilaginibacter auburnensis TaxID=1457233 RepID=A0A2H9VQS6_9SPHI|nr:hypothetical protein [Mucilaginibacter auburnensis]PJJ83169.1 hypothetical protein CLV57_0147 [Mucilaginibacter auburnensis]
MKLHINKIITLAFICLLSTHAISQKLDTAVLKKNWIWAGMEWVDITKATPRQKANINRTLLAQKLTEDHYFYPRNLGLIGVRFT